MQKCPSKKKAPLRSFRCVFVGFVLILASAIVTQAAPLNWSFQPSKVGNELVEGGWSLDFPLAQINASPEFNFPLQLVYQSTRESKGLFGSQWFCPQLESSLIPQGKGVFLWTKLSGGQARFRSNPKSPMEFTSQDGQWKLNQSGTRYEISNVEGWKLSYSRGRLDWIMAPSGRFLDFQGLDTASASLLLRNPAAGSSRVLFGLAADGEHHVTLIQINGVNHQFAYKQDGMDYRLVLWTPPVGNAIGMYYNPEQGTLSRVVSIAGQTIEDSTDFQCLYIPPDPHKRGPIGANPARDPQNYWLKSDANYDYSYSINPKTQLFATGSVSAKSKTGETLQVSVAPRRGIISSTQGGVETKTYFYVAPGLKYNGKLRRVEKGGVAQIEYRYDHKTGLLTQSIDANGIVTYFEYPQTWSPTHAPLMDPKPIRVLRENDLKKDIVAEFAYDDYGQVSLSRDAAGQITKYSYSPEGELLSVTGPDGNTISYTYDSFGRQTSISQNKIKESVEYDEEGRVKARIAADGIRTEFIYNKRGQVESVSRAGKKVVEYLYDPRGKLVGEKDPLGHIKSVTRDAKGRLLAETAPNGSVTRYEYDASGRRTAQIDGNGNRITFSYDTAGRLIKQINPLGQTLTWTYDDKGHLIERGNGVQTITNSYDDKGRLTMVSYGNGQTIAYTYDKEGHIITATTPESKSDYFYDILGHLEAVRQHQGERTFLLNYHSNAQGLRTELMISRLVATIPSRGDIAGKAAHYETIQQLDYTYDGGRLASISSDGQQIASYQYDAGGRPTLKTFGNGMSAALSYDTSGRLSRVGYSGGPVTDSLKLDYQWDPANEVTSRSWNRQKLAYSYDPAGQLLKVSDVGDEDASTGVGKDDKSTNEPTVLEAYSYDKAGNMTMKSINAQKVSMTYDAANQLFSTKGMAAPSPAPMPASTPAPTSAESSASPQLPSSEFTYDGAGRLISSPDGLTRSYGWLDKVTSLTTPGGESVKFIYWPDGQLAEKQKISTSASPITSAPADETFLWDGLALIMRNDTLYIIEPHPSGGVPIASHPVDKPTELTYYLNDMLGTTLATVDHAGAHFESLTSFGQHLKTTRLGAENPPSNLTGETPNVPAPLPSTPSFPGKS